MADLPANLLLESLSSASRELLLSAAKHVDLPMRFSLQGADARPRYIYFVTSGVASTVIALVEGGQVETILMGRESLTSAFSLLGPAVSPAEVFMQVPGAGYRVPFQAVREAFLNSEEIRSQILRCVQQQSFTISQIAACNKLHEAEPRLARWLLMLSDRLGTDTFQITQQFMAQMLGTRRPTVALIAGTLQQAGFIEYSRGKMRILSHEHLETVACECYEVTRRLLAEMFD